MIGITSYGVYIPCYRMNRKIIFEQMDWFNPVTASVAKGEKAVANFDEDTITMASYKGDNLAFSLDHPPAIYGLVDFKDGGRHYLDLTDCTLQDMNLGMPDVMTFLKKYTDLRRGIHLYYWKAIPA